MKNLILGFLIVHMYVIISFFLGQILVSAKVNIKTRKRSQSIEQSFILYLKGLLLFNQAKPK